MNYVSIGDMAQAFQMRRHNVELQRHLSQLTKELTSGVKADLAGAVSGDFKALAGIDHSLETLRAYKTSTDEAELFTGALQAAFENVQDMTTDLAPGLANAATTGTPLIVETAAMDARQKFHSVVASLNTQVADRFLLSGDATDQRPILGSQDILDALMVATTGQVTGTGVATAVAAWFDAPVGGGGYLDMIYGGSAVPLSPFQIGPGDQASMDITAASPEIRDMLEALSLSALVAEGVLPGDQTGRALLVKTSANALFSANDEMADLRARLGAAEGHIADAATRNAAESAALEIARTKIIAADPYETASALEAVQTQIETLYTLTARLSRLSLADYLR
ncbi:flagellin [Defluviimonas sp. WL0050]|uniref:Flagellin n=1 Tax=Albidovulum litorale TaxID=2984134 RepID=A0ABT2ZMW7_9RHOB|nr:flagellin [Defluviimonas sp. WL0050]MCV2872438.1 flagellin [Defluviimonas sp. WL0050]